MGHHQIYPYPRALARSEAFSVEVDGVVAQPLCTSAGEFLQWVGDGPVRVVVRARRRFAAAVVRPLARGVAVTIGEAEASFTLPGPGHYFVEIDGLPSLYLFAERAERDAPHGPAPGLRYFAAGQVHEVGELALGADERIYIAGGAVVRGAIRGVHADGARIFGHGILDNSYFRPGNPDGPKRAIMIEFSARVRIDGIIIIEPGTWTLECAACREVEIGGLKILGLLQACDGIDIVGCEQVNIHDCFIRAGDDCVALKACDYSPWGRNPDFCRDVRGIIVERCVLHSFLGGSALEIGHELRCSEVRGVVFRDIDILAVHDFGAALAIHNADHALVADILYEDIRVEHHWIAAIDLRVVKTRYSATPGRGRIRNVVLRRVAVIESIYNAGYTISHIGGWDAEHLAEEIRFEDCTYGGRPITSLDDFECYARHVRQVSFHATAAKPA